MSAAIIALRRVARRQRNQTEPDWYDRTLLAVVTEQTEMRRGVLNLVQADMIQRIARAEVEREVHRAPVH